MRARLELFTSGIWQTNTTVLWAGARCVVVDPAYFPRELDAIAARAAQLGGAAAVVFTHGHWDHVLGHARFPDAPVHLSAVLARAIAHNDPRAARYLDEAREFDARWYVPRPEGHRWPDALAPVEHGAALALAGLELRALHLPGHSPEGLGLHCPDADALLVGDYLSPCEIPFVDDLAAYRATLDDLARLLTARDAPALVVPGHGPRLTRDEALALADEDRSYLEALARCAERDDAPAALALALPRAASVPGMPEHHRENCERAGLRLATP